MVKLRYILFVFALFTSVCTQAQQMADDKVAKVVNEVISTLDSEFIIPEVKPKLVEELSKKLKNGGYYGLESSEHLAKAITDDMQEISGDKHLYLVGNSANNSVNPQPQRKMVRMNIEDIKFDDVVSFEMLEGNVACISLELIPSVEANKEKFEELLQKVAKADALIIDSRQCRGGLGQTVAYLLSPFFPEPTLLTTYYSKAGAEELWTSKTEFGTQNAEKDVFVLTSKKTGSAGEAIAFYPQQYGRVTVVGQRSAGAGRPNQFFDLSEGFKLSVSIRTSIPPSGKQFQGVGVQPDILTAVVHAKTQAHLTALAKLKEKYPAKAAAYEASMLAISESVEKQQLPVVSPKDKVAIEQAVLGYIENFFENNTDEMLKYLHPDLAKGGVSKKRGEAVYFYEKMSLEKLEGMLQNKPFVAVKDQINSVQILDVFRNTASVKLDTGYPDKMKWVEYILLSKVDGTWKINNIMWDYYSMKRRMKRPQSN